MGKYMIIPYILLGVMDVRYLKLSLIHKNRTGKSIALFMESNLVAVILGIIMQGIGSNFIDSILIWPFYACFTWMILALIEYAFEYTGLGKAFECFKYIKRAVFVFTIVDTINMFIHSIIRIENVRMNKSGVAAWLYNLGYDAHIFITYVFVAVFILCFIYRILNSPRIYKVKYMQILTCMIIVSCINIVMFQLRLWENVSLLFYGILGAFVYEITFQYSHKVVKNRALQKIAEESELPMVVFGTDDSIIAYNKEAERLFDKCTQKCSLEEFCKAYNLYTPAALEKTYHKKISIMHEDKKLYFQCKYGELCENDNIAYAKYFVFEDITEITIVNSVMRYLETHDELTGLYNMKRFYEKVNEITNKYPDDKFAIMIFNISRFKIVNDMFGRKMGDAILKQISENCLAQCSDKRVYARVESDNFITLCPKSDLVIKDLEKKRNIKVTYNNITCTVHIRYGIYEVDYDSKVDVGTMCDRARMALDSIKNNGNCVAAVYNDNLRNKILKEHMYKEELTSAIENEDFKVYLQPQVRCEDVVLHDLRARLVAALLGEKRCAAVDTALLRGNRVQQALGVRGHGALRVADQRRGGGVGLEASAAAAGALFAVFRDDHVADLARRARVACQELAAEHHAAADARAERDDDGALRAAAAAEQRLAQRRGVCVVAEVDGKRSMRAQRASQVEVHKIQVRRKAHDAARVVHRAGAADAHAADGVLADRELRDDLTDAPRDGLGAEIDARRDRMLL